MGPQSLDMEVKSIEINKGIDTKQISVFLKTLHACNIFTAPSVFVGAPGEKETDFQKTVQFIVDHAEYVDTVNIFPLMITPGSEFSKTAKNPKTQTLIRLYELAKAASDVGIKVCVGEQTDEYVIFSSIYDGDRNY